MLKSVKEIFTDCTLCYHSCGTVVTVEDGKAIEVKGLKSHPLNHGMLCPKGRAALENVYDPHRLKYPLKKANGSFERITWDQALTEIAEKLSALKDKYGPAVLGVFSGSIGVENLEMAGLTHRFEAAFGSPNFFSVESICYRMRIRTRQITFGKYPSEELDSNLYILWGHNPQESDFPLLLAMNRNLKKGAKLVVIDPKKISLADRADMYIKIRPGTDGALALAMIHVIVNERLYDSDFIEKYTTGFDSLVPHIQKYTPEWAEKITWVPASDIHKLARLFAETKGATIYQGTCTQDQTANGTQNSRAFSVLQIITGNINNPGGWVINPGLPLGNIGMTVEEEPLGADQYPLFYAIRGKKSHFGVVTCLPEAIPEKIKAFFVIGGNPVVSMSDSNAFREAFKNLDLLIVHDLFMTETGELAHYVLPASSHLEKWGLAYTYNVCHGLPYLMLRKKAIEPLYESWSEWKVFTELAKKLGIGDMFPWQSEEELVAFELEPTGLTFEQLLNEKPEGLYFKEKIYGMREGGFPTLSRKFEIYSSVLKEVGVDPLPTYLEPQRSPVSSPELLKKYPLILSTGNRNRYYTHGQLRRVKSLQEKNPEPRAEMGLQTARAYGICDGDDIIIETNRGHVKMKALVSERIAEGIVLVPHGWPGEANVNLLTDTACREPIMGYPEVKALLCSVRKDIDFLRKATASPC
jgi:formate dehydrogenase (coenzyme F420) alpha subunit